jgi:hypothetical protein
VGEVGEAEGLGWECELDEWGKDEMERWEVGVDGDGDAFICLWDGDGKGGKAARMEGGRVVLGDDEVEVLDRRLNAAGVEGGGGPGGTGNALLLLFVDSVLPVSEANELVDDDAASEIDECLAMSTGLAYAFIKPKSAGPLITVGPPTLLMAPASLPPPNP